MRHKKTKKRKVAPIHKYELNSKRDIKRVLDLSFRRHKLSPDLVVVNSIPTELMQLIPPGMRPFAERHWRKRIHAEYERVMQRERLRSNTATDPLRNVQRGSREAAEG